MPNFNSTCKMAPLGARILSLLRGLAHNAFKIALSIQLCVLKAEQNVFLGTIEIGRSTRGL